uniref:AlNc14C304G10423 protein n=1 Tax=Albugo laibachii Nc14 TaxID=890382 RepID=F0WVW3_9STRA|nr:AlNc14C304G10423 [Albugo laibachii Nc14]CCA27494.1 AlNc14C550G12132 [Albugo laibachii Nc14]|eukprot:CCA27494.1 AlNc14C550G12132 [Albugo laibachii Nc14]
MGRKENSNRVTENDPSLQPSKSQKIDDAKSSIHGDNDGYSKASDFVVRRLKLKKNQLPNNLPKADDGFRKPNSKVELSDNEPSLKQN